MSNATARMSRGLNWLLISTGPALAQVANSGPGLNATPGATGGKNQSQGAAAPNEPTGRGQLETVVVTAQKRTERAQKVPSAIATVSPATLSRSGVRDFADINKALPDIHVDDVVGSTNIAILSADYQTARTTGPAQVLVANTYPSL